jgi:hypothetical protein
MAVSMVNMEMSSNKRNATEMGASSDKRQKTSGEPKESDSDRRGREKKEREQKNTEDAAEIKIKLINKPIHYLSFCPILAFHRDREQPYTSIV